MSGGLAPLWRVGLVSNGDESQSCESRLFPWKAQFSESSAAMNGST